jgi:NarL family two-component system response regulator LiaR
MATAYGTVIVADRHHQMLGGIHTLLGVVFDAVLMVADDRSLVEAVERMRPDLVIVDLSLPSDGDDLNVAHRLAAERPDLRIIVMSVHDEPAAVRQTLAAGAAGFVLKRSAATDLIPAVHEVVAGRTYVSPAARADAVARPAAEQPPPELSAS